MQLNGVPNKFEIFQEFYYVQNGVQLSYAEALRLYAQMDADTAADFEKYYQDETGYEIIDANGYNLDRSRGNAATKGDINVKYSLDAYAKKNGLVLDPQWSIYSAEEIIAMAGNGVNIPQDIVDIANTIMQSTAAVNSENEGEGEETTTDELSFLELIPTAQKHIEKCDKNNEKIEKEIQDLLPEQQKRKRNMDDMMKEQTRSLKEFEGYVREWNHIQTKINNGEALSTSEARRYAQLTGMFENDSTESMKENFSLDKREIAKSMNEINILAILGEKLADETIEIGDTLANYTSKANYKATRKQVNGEVGFLRAIIAMAQGKALAQEAAAVGNETQDFTEETQHSVNDIAQILGIENQIAGKDEVLGAEEPKQEAVGSEEAVNQTEEQTAEGTQSAQGEEKNPEVSEQEDFVVNDKNVTELIKEASDINIDLAKQTISALKSVKIAKDDRKFAQIAGAKVTKLVKEFQKQEEERQARIQEMEEENKQANQELENLTGKSADELNEEQPTEKASKEDEQQDNKQTDKAKVAELRQTIASNNEEIENIKVESESSKGEFANATAKEKEIISQAIPAEAEALANDTEYKEEIIPANKERLDFTDASGETLSKIGVYRIELGMLQIMAWQFEKGLRNVALGTISTGIGLAAQVVGDTPIPTLAEKATDKSVKAEDSAINDLTTLEAQIISVTGEEATQIPTAQDEENEEGVEGAENSEETAPAEGAEENAEVVEETEVTEAEETIEDTGLETTLIEEPAEETPAAPSEEPVEDPAIEETGEAIAAEETENAQSSSSAEKEEKEEDPEALADNAEAQQDDLEKQTDKQEDIVKDGNKTAQNAGKESLQIKKDEEKDAKTLDKEAKALEKQIQQEQEEAIKLTQESQKAVEKQNEIMAEYESLSAESESMMAEEEAKQMSQPKQRAPKQQGEGLASNSFTVTNTGSSNNQSKLAANEQRINELGIEFKSQDTIVIRNSAKLTTIQDSIKTKSEKFENKIKIKESKLKATEKKEKEKQKQLNKIFGAIGIAENIFSITQTTGLVLIQVGTPMEASGTALITAGTIQISVGTPLLSNPFTAAAGAALVASGTAQVVSGTTLETSGITLQSVGSILKVIGLVGTAACGVTKGIINIANGNLAAGLMAIGATAVSVATSFAGGGAAAGSALTYVSEGLSIVSSSAELVNNVRAVQGKEANGVMSKIGTIAGVGSAVTGAADSLGNMGSQNTLGKISTITSTVGTALSSTSQLMTEFGGNEKTASILGSIGGGLQTLGSIGQLANKNNNNDNKDENNNDNKNETTVDDKVNEEVNKLGLSDQQQAEVQASLDKFKNDPNFRAQVEGQRNAAIDQKLNEMGLSDKQKAAVKQKLQQSGNYSEQQAAQPQNNQEESQQPEQTQTTPAATDTASKETQNANSNPADEQLENPELEVTDADAATVDNLRSDNPAEETSTKNGETDKPEASAPEKSNNKTPDSKEQEEIRTNNKEKLGASDEFADYDDAQLQELINNENAKGETKDSALIKKYEKEQKTRAEFKKNKKMEKLNNILDITGQAANTAMSVAGMFMTQNEGQVKKKHAAPGKLTKRTKEIMKKNAKYRQRRVQALSKVQKYYA